jgi:hypothetical protein
VQKRGKTNKLPNHPSWAHALSLALFSSLLPLPALSGCLPPLGLSLSPPHLAHMAPQEHAQRIGIRTRTSGNEGVRPPQKAGSNHAQLKISVVRRQSG